MKKILIFIIILIGNLSLHCEEPCPPGQRWGKLREALYRQPACHDIDDFWKI